MPVFFYAVQKQIIPGIGEQIRINNIQYKVEMDGDFVRTSPKLLIAKNFPIKEGLEQCIGQFPL